MSDITAIRFALTKHPEVYDGVHAALLTEVDRLAAEVATLRGQVESLSRYNGALAGNLAQARIDRDYARNEVGTLGGQMELVREALLKDADFAVRWRSAMSALDGPTESDQVQS